MATVGKDPVENLAHLALVIASDVSNAVRAWLVTSLANAWFHQFPEEERKKLFNHHPANWNIVYTGLKALEGQSIVNIYETLKDEHKLHPIAATVRRKGDLRLHRHSVSHPMTVVWSDKKMQAFADADRDGYDLRPALVWDLQRSINEELRKHGRKTYNESFTITRDMAVALHMILDQARNPAYAIPTVDQLFVQLQERAPHYQAHLEKHPDGARDAKREKAAVERRQARKEKWAKQRAEKAANLPK